MSVPYLAWSRWFAPPCLGVGRCGTEDARAERRQLRCDGIGRGHGVASRSGTKRARPRRAAAPAELEEYQRKRDFERTPEPSGAAARRSRRGGGRVANDRRARLEFVVQKHAASH